LQLNTWALGGNWTIEEGASVDEQGRGTLVQPRLYQLVRASPG
jgi:hypothetical protein